MPVVVDGVIADAAALVAAAMAPDVVASCVAGHRSTEPGADRRARAPRARAACSTSQLRLGEGTGACLAVPVVQAAARILREMATFDAAGVTEK